MWAAPGAAAGIIRAAPCGSSPSAAEVSGRAWAAVPLPELRAAHPRAATLPAVAAFGVAPIGVADIIGGHGQLLSGGTKGHGGKQRENQQFLHFKGSFNGLEIEQRYKKRTKSPPAALPQVNFSVGLVHFRT